jgi:cell wall-associated NlpC family hydrolase
MLGLNLEEFGLSEGLYKDLLGKPFKFGHSGPEYYDCGGLVYELMSRLGHPPFDFNHHVEACAREGQIECALDHLPSLQTPEKYSILTFYNPEGFVNHVGMCVHPGWFIHTSRATKVVTLERLSQEWICRIAKIYKLK